ncbi:MAG: helix-turn-helix transcriptional regulator [Cyclobacteriaceae bacterium]
MKILLAISIFGLSGDNIAHARNTGFIEGKLHLDDSWDTIIYIAYIPTFEDMYTMSNDMIISSATIDSLGNFLLDIGFFPESTHLYRIHLSKKGAGSNSIIIGGKDENHLFLLANRESAITIESTLSHPPFHQVQFLNSAVNHKFQSITELVARVDSLASLSEAAKRQFLNKKLNEELLVIADTVAEPMVSLYAIYRSNYETDIEDRRDFYQSYRNKWADQHDTYFKAFFNKLPKQTKSNAYVYIILSSILALMLGFGIGRIKFHKKNIIKKLSVQEKRVFELLKKGATNQEISEEFNIGISTVKSHVSNILSKLNLKSRKDIIHME